MFGRIAGSNARERVPAVPLTPEKINEMSLALESVCATLGALKQHADPQRMS
jgi:hypothetical protein